MLSLLLLFEIGSARFLHALQFKRLQPNAVYTLNTGTIYLLTILALNFEQVH